jgi:hypothetical protein
MLEMWHLQQGDDNLPEIATALRQIPGCNEKYIEDSSILMLNNNNNNSGGM